MVLLCVITNFNIKPRRLVPSLLELEAVLLRVTGLTEILLNWQVRDGSETYDSSMKVENRNPGRKSHFIGPFAQTVHTPLSEIKPNKNIIF